MRKKVIWKGYTCTMNNFSKKTLKAAVIFLAALFALLSSGFVSEGHVHADEVDLSSLQQETGGFLPRDDGYKKFVVDKEEVEGSVSASDSVKQTTGKHSSSSGRHSGKVASSETVHHDELPLMGEVRESSAMMILSMIVLSVTLFVTV